ncbi:MAG: hypothetical protein JWN14_152 [Chthonomonadales bacterium]|nr:hypothetical protein [Chthonomonadales bacterium]
MKTGRTLPDLASELERQANAKRDFLAPAEALRVRSNGHTDLLVNEPFAVNEIAHGQLADYTGVPKSFYDRLRNEATDLQIPTPRLGDCPQAVIDPTQLVQCESTPLFDVLLNRLLVGKGGDVRMVRTLDGKARAFLSDAFSLDLDNHDVFRAAAAAIEQAGLGPEQVASCEVTERRLYLKVVSPKLEATIDPSNLTRPHGGHHMLKEPQVVQAGFILSNSETGLGSLVVQQTVFRLQCTNLWITEDGYRQRHLGKTLEAGDDGRVYRSDTRQADARARLLKIRDHIADALNETRFKMLVAKMQETTEVKLEGSIEKIVEVTARKFGLAQPEKEDVLKNLIEGADLSLWGLTNAITATAQTAATYDRSTELEAIGGRFFALPAAEVRELVRAA